MWRAAVPVTAHLLGTHGHKMEIINNKQEYDLITQNDNICTIGINGKPLNEMHAGHIHMVNEIRRLRPELKIICRLYTDQLDVFDAAKYFLAVYDPDTGVKVQKHGAYVLPRWPEYDIQDLYNWFESNTDIDYIININIAPNGLGHYMNNPDKMATAHSTPLYNLNLDNMNDIVAEAEAIFEDGEFYQWSNIIETNILRGQLMALISGVPTYKIRVWSNKDVYVTMAKKYIYDMFNVESIVIDPIIDTTMGIPLSGRLGNEFTQIEKEQIKANVIKFEQNKIEPTFTFSPKWMAGKILKQLTYQLPDRIQINIVKVE